MKYLLIITSFAFLFTSCIISPPGIDVEIPEPPQELAISTVGLPPSVFAMSFTRTFTALIGKDTFDLSDADLASRILVDSADIFIDYDGHTVELQKVFPGVYGAIDLPLIPNTVYQLRAHDYTTGKDVRAVTTLKPKVNFDDVKSLPLVIDDTTTFYSYEYKFTDVPGEENYYLVTATRLNLAKGGLSELEKSLLSVLGNDFQLYSDKVTGDGKPVSYYPQFPDTNAGDTLAVTLSHITKEHFNYLTAYKKSGSIFNSFLSEPVRSFPTNVNSGFGFFSLVLPDVRTIVLE